MHFEKTMCDRLGYKYKDLFGHLEFILNKMNIVLNNYGNGLSDEELKMLNELFLKLEIGQIEIIEFTRPIEKYLDVDEIYNENRILKDNNKNMQDEMLRTWERASNLISNIHYDELHHYKVMRNIMDILKNKEVGYMETCDILEKYIREELEKYE